MFLKYERVENGQAGLEEMVVNEISAAERRSQIAQLVLEQGKVTVAELVKKFQITETSIRRDLLLLEEDKRLKRVHGGAVPKPFLKKGSSISKRRKKSENMPLN